MTGIPVVENVLPLPRKRSPLVSEEIPFLLVLVKGAGHAAGVPALLETGQRCMPSRLTNATKGSHLVFILFFLYYL